MSLVLSFYLHYKCLKSKWATYIKLTAIKNHYIGLFYRRYRSQGIRFGNDGNDVNLVLKFSHELNVQRFEAVTGWRNKIQTSMDSCVLNWDSINACFGVHECFILCFHVIQHLE